MKPIFATSQFAIFDDVLNAEDAERLREYIENEEFVSVHAHGSNFVWRLEDGSPRYRRKSYTMPALPLSELLPREEMLAEARKQTDFYPTKSAMDPLMEAIVARAREHKELVGEEKKNWLGMIGKLYAYPAGSAISWHSDTAIYTGAYIYYAHPEWSIQWGGELLVADPESAKLLRDKTQERRARGLTTRKNHFTAYEPEEEAIMKNGYGHYVMPKPNRLVILAGSHPPRTTQVSPAAGNRPRLSLAGFFITPQGLNSIVKGGLGS